MRSMYFTRCFVTGVGTVRKRIYIQAKLLSPSEGKTLRAGLTD